MGYYVLMLLIKFTYNEKLSNASLLFMFNFHDSSDTVNKCLYCK